MEPAYQTKIGRCQIRFWYNSKTHKYSITIETDFLEPCGYELSKAKAEAIIDFLKIISTGVEND